MVVASLHGGRCAYHDLKISLFGNFKNSKMDFTFKAINRNLRKIMDHMGIEYEPICVSCGLGGGYECICCEKTICRK